MKDFIKKKSFVIIFSVAGAIGGFLYWKYVGCQSGTCPIKSVWFLSTLWGLALGYLSGSIINDLFAKIKEKKVLKVRNNSDQDQDDA
jgi:phosphate/sulfate permease